jgi:TfoX N-terminal domain
MTARAGPSQYEYAPAMTQAHHMSKPTEAGMARFATLLEELSKERDVVRASMFGMPGIKRRDGKAFCGIYGDDMIFKLEGEDHARALSLEGAHPFEPMAGRPMKAWVQVPPEHEAQYADLARSAEASLEG